MATRSQRAAAAVALSGAVVGVQLALLSGLLELPAFTARLAPTTAAKSALAAAFIAGAVLFSLPAGPLVDALGRRRALLAAAAAAAAAARAMSTAPSFRAFLAARAAAGAAFAVLNIAAPIYLAEIAPTAARGRYVSLYQLAITAGIAAVQAANTRAALAAPADAARAVARVLHLAELPSALLGAAVFLAAPETPAWLAARGRAEDARAARLALAMPADAADAADAAGGGDDDSGSEDGGGGGNADVEKGLLAAGGTARRRSPSGGTLRRPPKGGGGGGDEAVTFAQLVLDGSARRRLTIAVGVQVGQQLTGVNAIIFFAPTILAPMFASTPYAAAGPFLAALCIGAFNVAATLASLVVVERFGRKTLLLAAALPMAASLVALAAVGALGLPPAVALVATLAYIAAFAVAWGPVPFLISSEIFHISMRGKGMTVSSLVMNVVSLLVVLSFLHLHGRLGGGVFLLYAALTAMSAAFVWRVVPETRNTPLDRIDALLSKH